MAKKYPEFFLFSVNPVVNETAVAYMASLGNGDVGQIEMLRVSGYDEKQPTLRIDQRTRDMLLKSDLMGFKLMSRTVRDKVVTYRSRMGSAERQGASSVQNAESTYHLADVHHVSGSDGFIEINQIANPEERAALERKIGESRIFLKRSTRKDGETRVFWSGSRGDVFDFQECLTPKERQLVTISALKPNGQVPVIVPVGKERAMLA
jgi:hypothetical protein